MAFTLLHGGKLFEWNFDGGLPLPAGLVDASVGGGSESVVADGTAPSGPNSLRCIGTVDGYPHTQGGVVKISPALGRQSFSIQARMKSALSGANRRCGFTVRDVDSNNYIMAASENAGIMLTSRVAGIDYTKNPPGGVPFAWVNTEWTWVKLRMCGNLWIFSVSHPGTPDTFTSASYTAPLDVQQRYVLGDVKFGVWCAGNTGSFDDVIVCENNHLAVVGLPVGGYVTLNSVDYKAYNGICRIDLDLIRMPITSFIVKNAAGTTLATFAGSAYGGDVWDAGLGNATRPFRTGGVSIIAPYESAQFALNGPAAIVADYFTTGNLAMKSSMVDPYYATLPGHSFQYIEGPGWPGNSIVGSYIAHEIAGRLGDTGLQTKAKNLLAHSIYDGQGGAGAWPNRFFEMSVGTPTGLFKGVRKSNTDAYYHNYSFNNDWESPFYRGWTAWGLMLWYNKLPAGQLKTDCGVFAKAIINWSNANVTRGANGNFPRYSVPTTGAAYPRPASETFSSLGEGADPNAQYLTPSIASHIMAMILLDLAGLANYSTQISTDATSLYNNGPFHITVNQDYDSVGPEAIALCAIALYEAAGYLNNSAMRTRADGWMARSLSFRVFDATATAKQRVSGLYSAVHPWEIYWAGNCYFWEQAAVAYGWARKYLYTAADADLDLSLSTLSQIAAHKYGPNGWTPEGILWRYDAGYQVHMVNGTNPGDIKWTEPLMNNIMHGLVYLLLIEKGAVANKQIVSFGVDNAYIVGDAGGGGGGAPIIGSSIVRRS